MPLAFKSNEDVLTLGVEMEVQILDGDNLLLTPRAPDILQAIPNERLVKEMFRSTLELITGVCKDVHDVSKDLSQSLADVRSIGEQLHLKFAGTGTNPVGKYDERILSASPRYHALLDRNQWLIRRMAVYGLHVHIGMPDGDACIRFSNFFLQFIPHLIGLSASSPYWTGADTGLCASRPTMYEAHPTSGRPIIVGDWNEFSELYDLLIQTHSIESIKDVWWDMRPSPVYGTLEIRICDGPATMLELESIVAFIHLLAHWFFENEAEFFERNNPRPEVWIMRENKWRSIRYGIDADIISYETYTEHKLSDNIYYWLDKLTPYVSKLKYEKYVACIHDMVEKGNSSSRQREVMRKTGDIMEVVRFNVQELECGKPIWL